MTDTIDKSAWTDYQHHVWETYEAYGWQVIGQEELSAGVMVEIESPSGLQGNICPKTHLVTEDSREVDGTRVQIFRAENHFDFHMMTHVMVDDEDYPFDSWEKGLEFYERKVAELQETTAREEFIDETPGLEGIDDNDQLRMF